MFVNLSTRNLRGIILRPYPHSFDQLASSISDVCQGTGMDKSGGNEIGSVSKILATPDLSKGFDALCRCHVNESLCNTLKVYSEYVCPDKCV